MLLKCCATHNTFLEDQRSFGMQNLMVTFIFRFGPRKGQFQVKLVQIRSNFQIQNFLTKTCLYCPVLPQDSKNVIYFHVWQLKMGKMCFKKWWHHLSLFWGNCSAQNKDTALKHFMPVACMYLYSVFFITWKFWILMEIIFKNGIFEFWGAKWTKF